MNYLAALLASALLSLPACAAIDEVIDWNTVTINARVDSEAVVLSARMQGGRLVEMTAVLRGKQVPVPSAELDGLPSHVALRTLRILSPDSKGAPGPTFNVEMQALPKGDGNPPSATLRFFFSGLSYTGRTVDLQEQGAVTSRETKPVGQPVQRARR